VEFPSNLSAIYTKLCAQTFPPIFGLFAIFDRNFAKIVAPPSDMCENCVVQLKEESLVKKCSEHRRNRAINSNAIIVRTMHPSNARYVLRTRSVTKKNKHHIFASTVGARSEIFSKMCMVIELVVPIVKGAIHFFHPSRSFSYRVHGKN